jgi:hypothetical protein
VGEKLSRTSDLSWAHRRSCPRGERLVAHGGRDQVTGPYVARGRETPTLSTEGRRLDLAALKTLTLVPRISNAVRSGTPRALPGDRSA